MMNMKKLLALLLAIVMVVGMFPMNVFAEDEEPVHLESCTEGCTGCECTCHQVNPASNEPAEPESPADNCPNCDNAECTGCTGTSQVNDDDTPGDNTTGDNTTSDNTTGDNTTGDNTTGDNTTGDNTTGDNTTGDNTTGDNTTGDNTTGDNTTGDNTTGDNTTGDNTSGDNTTGDNTTGDNTTGDKTICDTCKQEAHLPGCPLYCAFCGQTPCICKVCTNEQCKVKNGHVADCPLRPCTECTDDPCSCEKTEEPAEPSLYEQLMAVKDLEELYTLVFKDNGAIASAAAELSFEELTALVAHVEELYAAIEDPDEFNTESYDMLTEIFSMYMLCPDCEREGGEHEAWCPRYQQEVLLPNDGYIYFDLYYGNIIIKDGVYTGYVRGSNGAAQLVTGTHNNAKKYYIFQSKGEAYPNGSIPNYPRVTYGGQSWGDFITNHPMDSGNNTSTNVDHVIAAWGSVEHLATSATRGAAVDAGRQPTNHYIDIQSTTNGNTFNVVIDDIWSSFSARVDSSDDSTNMGDIFAGFNYKLQCTNNTLNLKLVGDNRLGRLHCATHDGRNGQYTIDKNHTNKMTVTTLSGSDDATLTVCNITENADHGWTAAEIGGTDGTDHTVKLEFNQGTIYAGSAYGDFGSGIGGGGNGDGYVTIKGGRITAITSATGAAIGGGCGTTGPGGYGNVTITNGEVYAFNYQPCGEVGQPYSDAMPTAIGGGSSGLQIGGLGIVNISGGKVFAYSQVGNAIGGGGGGRGKLAATGFYSATGGIADVTISGGTVDAISGRGCAIGGGPGGGRGYTAADAASLHVDSLNDARKVSANGGTAKLTISGGTVRSGSIGGGSPLVLEDGTDYRDKYGFTVGAAVVNISGGNTHGQVVMNGVIKANTDGFANNVHPTISGLVIGQNSSFTMTGGTIDNTPIGEAYHFVEKNGGAVYINSGSASMSGGTIQDAESPLGGAFYMQGGTFTMSGGTIQNCRATNGGAVYLSNGTVTMASGTGKITNTTATNGGAIYLDGGTVNIDGSSIDGTHATVGGGVYVHGGTYSMNGDGIIKNCDATNGAGVYIEGGTCNLTNGTISNNTATTNGGAVYVANTPVNFGGDSGTITISGNKAVDGAGLYITQSNIYTKTEIKNGQITGNIASSDGGGIYHTGKGTCIITGDGQLTQNQAVNGGGLYIINGSDLTVTGGLIYGNEAISTTTIPTAYYHTNNVGVGGGIYVGPGVDMTSTSFVMQSETKNVGIYDNDASNAADDVYVSHEMTTIKLPGVEGMKLTGFNGYATGWFEDYATGDTMYAADNALNNQNITASEVSRVLRYDDQTTTFRAYLDGTYVYNTYICLELGKKEVGKSTLTITKVGADVEPDQVFVFRIEALNLVDNETDEFTMEVTITGTGTVEVVGVPNGTYRITEVTSWSSRYTPDKAYEDVTINDNMQTAKFTNSLEKDKWLDGNSKVLANTAVSATTGEGV